MIVKKDSAKWLTRFWAWLIDIIIVEAVFDVFYMAFFPHYGMDFGQVWMAGSGAKGIIFFLYWTFFEGRSGRSIGKMALNIKVVGKNGKTPSYGMSAVQSFGKAFLLPLDCLIGWFAMPGSGQRLFNRLSDTYVIKK